MVNGETLKKRILVVDDEENLRHMLQVMLQKQGYLVEQATDGAEAVRMVSAKDYDFILCDMKMPVLDGAGFLELTPDSHALGGMGGGQSKQQKQPAQIFLYRHFDIPILIRYTYNK